MHINFLLPPFPTGTVTGWRRCWRCSKYPLMCCSFIVAVSEHLIVHCSYACLYFLPVFYSFRRDRPSLWCIRLPIILPASMAVTLKPCHCWLVHQMAALLAGSSDGCSFFVARRMFRGSQTSLVWEKIVILTRMLSKLYQVPFSK